MDLHPLTLEEVIEQLSSLMLPAIVDVAFAERLFRHAGGHPFFTLATLQAAFMEGGQPTGLRLPHPGTVQGLLDARISKLSPSALPLLRVAAVCGEDLTAERAARMLDCTVLALAEPWSALEAADVLRGDRFSHDLVHEAALARVPDGPRQALHRQFATLLSGEDLADPSRLAWHWEQGERVLEAGRCWVAAAKAAGKAGLIQDQSELFRRAADNLESAGAREERFEALLCRLEGMQLRPGGGAVLEALPEVEALADTPARQLRCRLARVEALLGLERSAEAVGEAQIAADDAARHPELLADAQALLAQALVRRLRFDDARTSARQALEPGESVGDSWQSLRALQASSFVHFFVGEVPEALERQREAVKVARTLGHRFEAAAGEGHMAALLAVIGDVPLRTVGDRFPARDATCAATRHSGFPHA